MEAFHEMSLLDAEHLNLVSVIVTLKVRTHSGLFLFVGGRCACAETYGSD